MTAGPSADEVYDDDNQNQHKRDDPKYLHPTRGFFFPRAVQRPLGFYIGLIAADWPIVLVRVQERSGWRRACISKVDLYAPKACDNSDDCQQKP